MKNKISKVTRFTFTQVVTSNWFCIITILGVIGTFLGTQMDKIMSWVSGGKQKVADAAVAAGTAAAASNDNTFLIPFLIVLVLFVLILIYGSNIANSVVEEKSARIIETLLCYVKPIELLTGKILGYVCGIIVQLAIWIGYYCMLANLMDLPAKNINILSIVNVPTIILMIGSIIIGFAMYAFAFAALASFTDNAQDSTQLMMPVGLMIMAVYFVSLAVLNGVKGIFITILSYAPFCSPIMNFVMIDVKNLSWQQMFLYLIVQFVELLVIIVVCSKIYRRGVVSYGIKKSGFHWKKSEGNSGSDRRSEQQYRADADTGASE